MSNIFTAGMGSPGSGTLPLHTGRLLRGTRRGPTAGRAVVFFHLERVGGSNLWHNWARDYSGAVNLLDLYAESRNAEQGRLNEMQVLEKHLPNIRQQMRPVFVHLHTPLPVWRLLSPEDMVVCLYRVPAGRLKSHLNHAFNYLCEADKKNEVVTIKRYLRPLLSDPKLAATLTSDKDDRLMLAFNEVYGSGVKTFDEIRQETGLFLDAVAKWYPPLIGYYEDQFRRYFGLHADAGIKDIILLAREHFDVIEANSELVKAGVEELLGLPYPPAITFQNEAPGVLRFDDMPTTQLSRLLKNENALYASFKKSSIERREAG
jgi:hypothetical protein